MNLAVLIRGNQFMNEVIDFLIRNGWSPVPFEGMNSYLYQIYYHNCPGDFMLLGKKLPGDVPASIFVGCDHQRKTYVVFCVDDYLSEKRFYNRTNMDLFKVNFRSFIIKHSRQS